ncbi:Crp/Fnr family transcriptional regulator [Streptomyces albidoflavus]
MISRKRGDLAMKNLPISWQSGFGESSDWPPGTFLSQMPPELQEAVLGMGDRKSFLRGEVLIQEDARDTDVILLRTGAAKVTSCLGRRVTLLGVRVAGEVVGEMAASDGSPRSATVTACSAVEATVVTGAEWNRLLCRDLAVWRAQQQTVNRRLRRANRWRAVASAANAKICVALALRELASDYGRPGRKGVFIDVALSQAELGSLVGLRESTVQKALAELREDRAVDETRSARYTVFEEPLRRASEGA